MYLLSVEFQPPLQWASKDLKMAVSLSTTSACLRFSTKNWELLRQCHALSSSVCKAGRRGGGSVQM